MHKSPDKISEGRERTTGNHFAALSQTNNVVKDLAALRKDLERLKQEG